MINKIRDILIIGLVAFLFPATFGAFLLHEKFKQEAYIDNNLSQLQKVLITQKLWVSIGIIIDIIKLILIC